ncbi:MAG: RagB/SusD family nutrient uptake outer membrane protein [Rikenellaceae bacterium]
MKKIYLLLLTATLSVTSCSDFLDIPAQGSLTEDVFFAEEEGALMSLNAAYSRLRQWNLIGFPWFAMMELASDDSDTGSEPSDGSVARLDLYDSFQYDASLTELNGYWTGNFQGIAMCNTAIDNLDILENEETRILCIAQARFLRGFFYFNLVRVYGGVPLIVEIQTDPDEYNQPRATVDEVYAQIIEDMAYAAENLPTRQEWGAENYGRVTKGTADGMLAKVYMQLGDYTNAKKYAENVINRGEYSLFSDYRDLFCPDNQYCDEIMFQDQYCWTESYTSTSEYVKCLGIRGQIGWGYMTPSEALANAYEEGDPREEATIFNSGDEFDGEVITIKDTANPRAFRKVLWPSDPYWNTNTFGNTNCHVIFLRYADVLLLYAEACNELGNTSEALTYLEMVRSRARNTQCSDELVVGLPEITETDKSELRLRIWEERRIELAMEGHRFYDLIRYEQQVPGYAAQMLAIDGKTSFNYDQHSTFLIPQTEIDLSGGVLVQN